MASFIESEEYQSDEQEVVAETHDEVEEQSKEQVVNEQPEVTEESLPDKYQGKDLKEIVRMHQEAEKLIGRQGSEVGELRKIVDDFIKAQVKAQTPAVEDDPEIDFFEDPKKAVAKAIETSPAVQEARNSAKELKKMQTISRLQAEFPNFEQVVQDPEFAQWIKSSPVRTRLYASADADFDYESAAELLGNWNAIKKTKSQVEEVKQTSEQIKKQTIKAATVDTGNTGVESKKVYRRADIIRLMQTDPDKYDLMQDEIMSAYREGRVR